MKRAPWLVTASVILSVQNIFIDPSDAQLLAPVIFISAAFIVSAIEDLKVTK